MKSKAPLTLMELLVMVLVFALATALCVQIFVMSDLISQEVERKDRAVLEVQNIAETVKGFQGNLAKAAETLEGTLSECGLTVYYDEQWNRGMEGQAVYEVTVMPVESPQERMGTATVTASCMNGEELFGLTIAWQEVKRDES